MNYKTRITAWAILAILLFSGLFIFQYNTVLAETNSSNSSINSTINSTLSMWTIFDSYYVNDTVNFLANYSYENGSIAGIEICKFDGVYMNFNMTTGLYYYEKTFDNANNYTVEINCHKQGYENLTGQLTVEILPLIINITADNDNDTFPEDIDCDDNNPDINPGQKEKLYNGLDDDCNLNTLDYLFFNIYS